MVKKQCLNTEDDDRIPIDHVIRVGHLQLGCFLVHAKLGLIARIDACSKACCDTLFPDLHVLGVAKVADLQEQVRSVQSIVAVVTINAGMETISETSESTYTAGNW